MQKDETQLIYDLVLEALKYEDEKRPGKERKTILDEILRLNEEDFAIAKEMFF